jgi:protein-S-isoprenylcysteine O-methyltransferase Ste14
VLVRKVAVHLPATFAKHETDPTKSSLNWRARGCPALITLTNGVGIWAMLENEHFEQFVRIQTDRSHRVVTTGPYHIIRHPG